MERIEAHMQEETYGAVHKFPDEMATLYGHLILMIVAGDGEVSAEEWRYMVARGRAMGLSQAVIDSWQRFDYKHGDLEAAARQFYAMLGATGYAFIYDAVKVARADGYHEGERRATRRAAAAAGIPEFAVTQIENLVAAEDAIKALRVSLMYPESSPFHDRR
jgi:uncharacterized tellurite resistance protein B-like protein